MIDRSSSPAEKVTFDYVEEGREARRAGLSRNKNPYRPEDEIAFHGWQVGWDAPDGPQKEQSELS